MELKQVNTRAENEKENNVKEISVKIEDECNKTSDGDEKLLYGLEEKPAIHVTILLGLQNFMIMFLSQVTSALLMAPYLCMSNDIVGQANIISSMIFVSGITTIIQTFIGTRLPIIQGSSSAFLTVVISILSVNPCPSSGTDSNSTTTIQPNVTSDTKEWHIRMQELQGSLMIASFVEIVIGFSGLLGLITRYIGPITIGVVVSLIGLSLIPIAMRNMGESWPIGAGTTLLIVIFSQYLRSVRVPVPAITSNWKCSVMKYPIFLVFSIILAMIPMWLLCFILTSTGVFSSTPGTWQYASRTDTRASVLRDSPWVRVPYPFQWGLPSLSLAASLGMLAAVLSSIIESVGDYHACARLCDAPVPKTHAINRGIGMEGIGVLLCGMFGVGLGSTSYSNNIAIISVTKAASRRIAYAAGVWMILLGLFSKFGALFASMPGPIVGATFFFSVSMILAAGLSSLQQTDMQSTRNMFVVGFSVGVGLGIPSWITANPKSVATGSHTADQVLLVLLRTQMLLGGVTAFILDNTLKKAQKDKERLEMVKYVKLESTDSEDTRYDCPFGMTCLRKQQWTSKIPFLPTFTGFRTKKDSVTKL